jgi:hypothetical protein
MLLRRLGRGRRRRVLRLGEPGHEAGAAVSLVAHCGRRLVSVSLLRGGRGMGRIAIDRIAV